ncbi:MAG: hypothetical protein B6229_05225 [Spirochaetaceae bacterium 4572_7]|nr:MAG: hypothetical protein B6229_05225 [Spirochaetaceae bacterium 4572_7]
MKLLVLILSILTSLYTQSIDALLQDYEEQSELSKKTKDESAGNLIVYTRDDLERMQVESLKDILKSLRFFAYAENRLSQPDILNQDPLSYYSKSVRVYLNEHELLSSLAGSGLILFGDMEMDFIDHVEIYQGFPSFDFGVEPATIVIRLYSKNAGHDEGGRVKATLGSYGANKENIYYSDKGDNLSYFVYANQNDDKKDTYPHDGEVLRRDNKTSRFYGSLEYKNHTLELHAMRTEGDAFFGSAVGNVPSETFKATDYLSISTSSKFLDNSVILNLSYINSKNEFASVYPVGNPIFVPAPGLPFNTYAQIIKEDSFTISLKKEWNFDSHIITAGIQYRYKYFDLSDLKFNGIDAGVVQPYDADNIYSIFLEDSITINENNLITISIMDQEYIRGGSVCNQNTLQLRLGYIYTNTNWVAKTFLSYQEFASEPYMTISPHYGNTELEAERYTSIFQEFSYRSPSTLSKIILGYGVNKKIPILDENFVIQNSKIDISGHSAALEFTLFFNQKDKLELQSSYTYIESPYGNEASKHYTQVIRMLNSISNFDIFNELTIHSGYQDMEDGYDYSAGVKYRVSKDFYINFKGENIFNSALKRSYVNQIDPITRIVSDEVIVPVIERKFMLGMEYLF